ncbi:DNA breaking-rejoining protein [Sodalis sp. RH21]|uniref:DNA breaking-rejoining protein n=1 Tax=unclassified Sodalis (in: enterobacteria) TaxID=2636512 RepID=UPI0039B49424
MANAFELMAARMDAITRERFGKLVVINNEDYIAVESHFITELGPLAGDGISLVVFDADYQPHRNDTVVFNGGSYIVTRHQPFNGKPQIWIEGADVDN